LSEIEAIDRAREIGEESLKGKLDRFHRFHFER